MRKGRWFFWLWTTLVVSGLSLLFVTGDGWCGNPFVSDELLIQHKAGASKQRLKQLLDSHGAVVNAETPQIRLKRIKVSPHAIEKTRETLARHPDISYVEPNYIATPSIVPDDSSYPSQWHLPKIFAPQGWDISTGASNIPIAILDTGVDPFHPDLSAKLIPGYNFYANNTDTHDIYGHGTKVAGSAAALSNNATGVTGVAWQNPIMPLVISDPSGYATYYNMASAIIYAADHGAKVINISFGGTSSSTTLQNAINYAWSKGAIIVASAGNSSSSQPTYPAACDKVIAVSATGSSDMPTGFTNYGNWIDVAAPGISIVTTSNGGNYGSVSGTSFSSPITAGLAALIFSVNPELTNAQVEDIIKQNADDLGTPGFDSYYGFGRINVYESLLAASNSIPETDTTPPLTSITSPVSEATISGSAIIDVSATDDKGVAKVELYVDGVLHATDNTGPYSFILDTTKYTNGKHTLQSIAYDTNGNIGQSPQITVNFSNMSDNTPPVVVITSPVNGSILSRKVYINISASDNVGVQRLELYIDNSLIATSNSSILKYTWNTLKVSRGAHIISAKAFDAEGNNSTTSITTYKK